MNNHTSCFASHTMNFKTYQLRINRSVTLWRIIKIILTLVLFSNGLVAICLFHLPTKMDSFLNSGMAGNLPGEDRDNDPTPLNNPLLSTLVHTYTTTQNIVVPLVMPMIDKQIKKNIMGSCIRMVKKFWKNFGHI